MGRFPEKERLSLPMEERAELMHEIVETQRAFKERMAEIDTWPGDIASYELRTGERFRPIDLPNGKKYLEGRILEWEAVDKGGDEVEVPARWRELLDPRNWRHLTRSHLWNGGYSEVLFEAVNLEADALVNYDISGRRGEPVKRLEQPETLDLKVQVSSLQSS